MVELAVTYDRTGLVYLSLGGTPTNWSDEEEGGEVVRSTGGVEAEAGTLLVGGVAAMEEEVEPEEVWTGAWAILFVQAAWDSTGSGVLSRKNSWWHGSNGSKSRRGCGCLFRTMKRGLT
ncbi:hypothetical protein OROMI_012568 [Orobanche minor]